MKALHLYEELKNAAERLGVTVVEHSFKATGVRARSGMCRIRGRIYFIMDKHCPMREKIELLAEALAALDSEAVFMVPAVRDLLKKHGMPGESEADR